MKIEPRIMPGFMELLPNDQILFNNMLNTIENVYKEYGFVPLDTPMLELTEVLLAKCGGETAKQTYSFKKGDTDMSLRFDLTVPLARYTSLHYNDLTFPFRRYHISKVFRGEKPQRGRFRELYQCDIDIIGNGELSILNDAEIPSVIYNVFKTLNFDEFTIRINNRKLLNGFFNSLGISNFTDVLRIIDKLEKIGLEKVILSLKDLNISDDNINKIVEFINIKGSNDQILNTLSNLNIDNELYLEGLNELKLLDKYIEYFGVPRQNYQIDITIARGLDYYTGTVYETFLNNYKELGSVCSGGRYDNLTEYYSNNKLQGVGMSIGLSRLFWQLKEAKIIESNTWTNTKVIVLPMTDNIEYCINFATKLRQNKIITQVYLENAKLKKMLNYANKLQIPFAVIIGDDEISNNEVTLKNMIDGTQEKVTLEKLIKQI